MEGEWVEWVGEDAWKACKRSPQHGAGVVVIHHDDPAATCGCGRLLSHPERAAGCYIARCNCGATHTLPL